MANFQLGVNLLASGFWPWARPYNNEALLMELPWSGDWSNRVYEYDRYRVANRYRAVISARGSMPYGIYTVQANPDANLKMVGAEDLGNGQYKVATNDNIWIEFRPSKDIPIGALGLVVFEQNTRFGAGGWTQDFLDFIAPMKVARPMDRGGAFSAHASGADAILDAPTHQREPRVSSYLGVNFRADPGQAPGAFKFPIDNLWLNPPLFVSSSQRDLIQWTYDRKNDRGQTYVSVSNELWQEDSRFPQALFVRKVAQTSFPDPSPIGKHIHVPGQLMALEAALQAKRWLEPLGVEVIFEWHNASPWMFENVGWRSNQVARDKLREIGHFATACYFAPDDLDDVYQSVDDVIVLVKRNKAVADELGIPFHIYECGPEFYGKPKAWARDPRVIAGIKYMLSELNKVLDPRSLVCYYGDAAEETGQTQWGLGQRYSDRDHPKYKAILEFLGQ